MLCATAGNGATQTMQTCSTRSLLNLGNKVAAIVKIQARLGWVESSKNIQPKYFVLGADCTYR